MFFFVSVLIEFLLYQPCNTILSLHWTQKNCFPFRILLSVFRNYQSVMCGRFSIAVRISYLADHFGPFNPSGISLPKYNIAPGEEVPVITGTDTTHITMMHWGLIPSWTTGERTAQAVINARAEGLGEMKMFRTLLSHGRCIIPATGFYEWKKSGNRKYPMYFRMKDREIFGMAGLCNSMKAPEGRNNWSFTIITTTPNSLVVPVHNRMPAILKPEDEKKWLGPGYSTNEGLASVLNPFPAGMMEAYKVTKKVNNPSFKSEAAVEVEISGPTDDICMWDTR